MAERIRLQDRAFLTAIQSDKFKTGCFSVNFLRPLRKPEAAWNALIPSVLLGGSTGCPDIRSISIRLDSLYGASVGALVRKKGETQAIGLYADFVEDSLVDEPVFVPLVRFVGELLFSPLTEKGGFRPETFENERTNLINSIRAACNNKQRYANRQLFKAMCREEPYGIPANGEEEDLDRADPKQLYRHYRRLLTEAQIEIFYLGRLEPQSAAGVFRKMLSDLLPGTGTPILPTLQREAGELRLLEEAMPLAQSKLAIGFRCKAACSPKELAEMLCFTVLLGGSSGSKLFVNVREALSLCYYANAGYDKYKGVMWINSGIAAENYERTRAEIYRQLEDCAAGRFTEEELACAKRLLRTQLRSDLDSPGRLDEYYLGQAILGRTEPLEALIREIDRVDAETVRSAAKTVKPDTEFFLRGVGE